MIILGPDEIIYLTNNRHDCDIIMKVGISLNLRPYADMKNKIIRGTTQASKIKLP